MTRRARASAPGHPDASDLIDDRMIHGLHVSAAAKGVDQGQEPHTLFQVATVDALFEGRFDGDLTFAELAGHGDFGLGTLNALDGEMIAFDGRFLRADADGNLTTIAPSAKTPFAVVTFFAPAVRVSFEEPMDYDGFMRELNRHAPPGSPTCAVRVEGSFEFVHARSMPRQRRPYPSLGALAHEQHVFDFHDLEGTMVGFRFPDYARGLEVPGYHFHFADAALKRGGHVLSCRPRSVTAWVDHSADLRLELPPGVALGAGGSTSAGDIGRLERAD